VSVISCLHSGGVVMSACCRPPQVDRVVTNGKPM
jgi:hypothetical protein